MRMVKLQDSVHICEGELANGRWSIRSVDGQEQAVVLTGTASPCSIIRQKANSLRISSYELSSG
ncbi:MAG: hypothetical protein K8R08_04025 [Methanosarcinales archaeon]|nr:hypothetical protein [Methanosarcinales archaeon]